MFYFYWLLLSVIATLLFAAGARRQIRLGAERSFRSSDPFVYLHAKILGLCHSLRREEFPVQVP